MQRILVGGTYYGDGDDKDFSAECALWKAALDYMTEVAESVEYEIEVAHDYMQRRKPVFRCYDGIQFDNLLTGGATVQMRVTAVELDLVDGYACKLTISNSGKVRPWKVIGQLINSQNMEQR